MTPKPPNLHFPPHSTFRSQHSLNYFAWCQTIKPNTTSVQHLRHLASLVPLDDMPQLLTQVRELAIQRCTATLNRARSDANMSDVQRKSYERYLGLARTGRSLTEETLIAARDEQIAANKDKNWTHP